MHVLVVEDDPVQAQLVTVALRSFSYTLTIVDDGERAVRFLQSESVDAIVLDWNLLSMSGIEVLRWLRAREELEIGVLLLTSRSDEIDVVIALESGADDYMIKPFRAQEFAARVSALLRRVTHTVARDTTIAAGDYILDLTGSSVTLLGRRIDLTATEFQLVALLFSRPGTIISRDSLVRTAWGKELNSGSRSLDTHMYRIRRKMKLGPENGLRLTSIYSIGYRLDIVEPEGDDRIPIQKPR